MQHKLTLSLVPKRAKSLRYSTADPVVFLGNEKKEITSAQYYQIGKYNIFF